MSVLLLGTAHLPKVNFSLDYICDNWFIFDIALGLDLPEGETISFPVKNMYSNDARKEGDQQKDLDPLAAIPKSSLLISLHY